jgi:hypothetical protein
VTVALGFVVAELRARVHLDAGSDYSLGTQGSAYGITFAKQALAGVPLTYELFDPQRLFPSLQKIAVLDAGPYAFRIPAALLFAVGFFVLARARASTIEGAPRRGLAAAAALGMGLALLPVPFIAASGKYQRELQWGWGYLPAFVQTFGVALAIAAGLRAIRMPTVPAALALFVVADLTAGTNAIVGEALGTETASLGVVERAFQRGLARDAPPGATIVLPRTLPWVCENPLCPDGLSPDYLLFGLTGRRYSTVAPDEIAYANITAFRLTYATNGKLARVELDRGGGAPSKASYEEHSSGTWSLQSIPNR